MSLSTALGIAQNSLLNTQRQTGVLARNVANAHNPDYARRTAVLSSLAPGSRVIEIARATDMALFKQNLAAISGYEAQRTVVSGLDWLAVSVNGVDNASSPATLIGKLQEAVQLYASNPTNRTVGESAVEAARDVLRSLNDGTRAIQTFRADMDRQIATGVGELNALLAEFKIENDKIVSGTLEGQAPLDSYDRRDAILKKIAEYVPISTITRTNNDMMIVTADGTTLFETIPRHVGFTPVPFYNAATAGNGIFVDGIPLATTAGANTTAEGTLAAMVQMRDDFSVGAQTYLDEIARGLVAAFAETDPNPGPPPAAVAPGLFTWPGAPAMPADAALIAGLAETLTLNPLIDPWQGGDPERLRDGATFDANPDSNASFTALLNGFAAALDKPVDFVNSGNTSLMQYSASAINWMEHARSTASGAAEIKGAMVFRTTEALSNATAVNMDEEIALMLELEHSYAASAKMLQMIDELLRTLLNIAR